MESWEEIALRLAGQAGIATPRHELIDLAGKAVMLSRRFDREGRSAPRSCRRWRRWAASAAALRRSSMPLLNTAPKVRRTPMSSIGVSSSMC
uniref:Tiorf137 protein n=1 Tax=Agrobacterium tumefaciens TaxID=358 RepID=Q9R6C6_AGRTU|nr:tiorf137 [Agrobacterium tumefaciens]